MSRVLFRKLIGLGRDEDGAALVITLALLMFMYLTCAGVFAIGQSVKDKIHLQNACDAAAYSAAVVQADTLSRIATINKAMSWTYVSMVKRQQDYIVWKWLDEVKKRYHEDDLLAEEITPVLINRWQIATYEEIRSAVDGFDEKKFSDESFYSQSGGVGVGTLRMQIDDDGKMLDAMKVANDALVGNLKDRAEDAAKAVLKMNLPQGLRTSGAYCSVKIEKASSYLDYMGSGDESRFVQFSAGCHGPDGYVSYPWFPVVSSSDGIGRRYEQKEARLIAEWTWWMKVTHTQVNRIGVFGVRGSDVRDDYFNEHLAYPRKVDDAYFGKSGTITVGLAKYNENPWYRVFGDAAAAVAGAGDKLGGIFAAFNPHKSVEWTWALSSAKAGYRYKNEEYDEDPNQPKRAYRVDWKDGNQSWNLCVSDWDAVFVPVRSARMKAENGSWTEESGNEDFLREWIEAGNWQPLDGSARHDYAVAGKMPTLPQMHKSGSGLDWKNLVDMLYH